MDDLKIKNMNDLYKLLYPALETKMKMLKNKGYSYIKLEDIFNYLKNQWQQQSNLTLYDLVNDIFNVNEYALINYVNSLLVRKDMLKEEYL